MKILLGVLIGVAISFTGVALAHVEDNSGFTGQQWTVPGSSFDATVSKVRDGSVVCYTFNNWGNFGGISCLKEN